MVLRRVLRLSVVRRVGLDGGVERSDVWDSPLEDLMSVCRGGQVRPGTQVSSMPLPPLHPRSRQDGAGSLLVLETLFEYSWY